MLPVRPSSNPANLSAISCIEAAMVAVMKIGGTPTEIDFHEAISARSDRWYSACLKITRNPDMAADAVQDALLNAWNKRHQFEQTARLDTWIHRIAINAALTQIRKNRPGLFESLESDIESDLATPHQALEEHELDSELARSLARLTELERVCFVLKHLEQWQSAEISSELAINEGRVKQAVFRAVKKLRISMQNLQREHYER
jgi:RNA polymerase sigma-70 factor (ECF subfamily)